MRKSKGWFSLLTLVLVCIWAVPDQADAKKRRRRRRLKHSALYVPPLVEELSIDRVDPEPDPKVRERPEKMIAASLVLQSNVRASPSAVGFAAEYQMALSDEWGLAFGAGLGLRENRTFFQPHVSAERDLTSFGDFSLHASGGIAIPIQLMTGTAATAVALRGTGGVRWALHDRLMPHVELVVAAGPFVTPSNEAPGLYAALQLLIGVSFGL